MDSVGIAAADLVNRLGGGSVIVDTIQKLITTHMADGDHWLIRGDLMCLLIQVTVIELDHLLLCAHALSVSDRDKLNLAGSVEDMSEEARIGEVHLRHAAVLNPVTGQCNKLLERDMFAADFNPYEVMIDYVRVRGMSLDTDDDVRTQSLQILWDRMMLIVSVIVNQVVTFEECAHFLRYDVEPQAQAQNPNRDIVWQWRDMRHASFMQNEMDGEDPRLLWGPPPSIERDNYIIVPGMIRMAVKELGLLIPRGFFESKMSETGWVQVIDGISLADEISIERVKYRVGNSDIVIVNDGIDTETGTNMGGNDDESFEPSSSDEEDMNLSGSWDSD